MPVRFLDALGTRLKREIVSIQLYSLSLLSSRAISENQFQPTILSDLGDGDGRLESDADVEAVIVEGHE